MTKRTVAVLFGGPSAEHEVSLKSGQNVVENLNRDNYEVIPVFISRDNVWKIGDTPREFTLGAAIDFLKHNLVIDLAFLALHGPFGEDGTIQGLLQFAGIPFTSSGVLASALAMDKMQSWRLYQAVNLMVPDQGLVQAHDPSTASPVGYPCVVKPNALGSTIGVSIVQKQEEFAPALELARQYGPEVVVQQFIKGVEVTCGVLDKGDNATAQALLPTEIVPKHATFFDYDAKYAPGASDEITPARLPEATLAKIQQATVAAHQILGCSGISRSDFIVAADQTVYLLETNTIPGLTEASLIPRALAAMGKTYPELLDEIIAAGLQHHR